MADQGVSDLKYIYDRCKHFGYSETSIRECLERSSKKMGIDLAVVSAAIRNNISKFEQACFLSKDIQLKDYQINVVKHMFTHKGIIIAFDVGKGKTLTAIASAVCLVQQAKFFGKKITVYIVTPTSLQENFKKEMRKFGVDPRKSNYEFYTIASFVNAHKRGEIECKESLLIIDEAHNLRKDYRLEFSELSFTASDEDKTRAYTFIKCAAEAWKTILLTATPAYNMPHDVVNLVAMVKGQDPPLYSSAFDNMMEDDNLFKQYFGCVFAFEKTKTDDFPKRIDKYMYVVMTPEYLRKYVLLEKKIRGLRSTTDDEEKKNAFMVKLRKASNNLKPCLKCIEIMNLIETGKKTIVYSEFISSGINIVKSLLDKKKIEYLEITGSVPKKRRGEIVDQINNPKGPSVLFITKAGGEGLDLRGIRQVILMEKGWTVESEEQVIGRAVRYKSHMHLDPEDRNVTVYHFVMVKPSEYKYYSEEKGQIVLPDRDTDEGHDLRKELSADLYMFEKSRTKKIATDLIMEKAQRYSVGKYACDY